MTYFRTLWADARRVLAEKPDLLVIAGTAALAFVLEHYLSLPRGIAPAARGAAAMLLRSVIYLALPLLSLLVLRVRPSAVGFGFGRAGTWLRDIGLLYAFMLPIVFIASRQPAFLRVYPYFDFARASVGGFLLAQLVRLVGMFAWEFIFRGYLLFGFERKLGAAAAIAVQTIPFVILHFGKPLPETLGSIVAGVALGIVAIRARSFIPCAILHFSVAATLDLFAVIG